MYVQFYFLGKYRCAAFAVNSPSDVARVADSVMGPDTPAQLRERVASLVDMTNQSGARIYSRSQVEHGSYGVAFVMGEYDGLTGSLSREFPPCPGLDYSRALPAERL